ncbi:MAG: hypothetical protein ACI36Z_01345 [Alloprevotella sp.]
MYIVYEGDQWLSCSSMNVKCICLTMDDAINKVLKEHKMTWDDFPEYDERPTKSDMDYELRKELKTNWQTQGHSVNYLIEEVSTNEWM